MYKIINRKKLLATIAADAVGSVLTAPARLLKGRGGPIYPGDIRSILVIRTAYIGDVVMTLPMLRPLRERFPYAKLSFLTSRGGAQALGNNPHVDEVIVYDPFWFYPLSKDRYLNFLGYLKGRPFDLVIEARADIREIFMLVRPIRSRAKVSYDVGGGGYLLTHVVPYPGLKHKVQYHLDIARYLGCEAGGVDWGIYLTPEEDARIEAILHESGLGDGFIAVHPGTRMPLKRWLTERYAAVYDKLMAKYGLPLAVLGLPEERPLAEEILGMMRGKPVNLAGALSLREAAGVLGRSRMFICNDSAPMHLAAAMGTPVVAIFGPSKSVETGPYGEMHRVVEKYYPCRAACDEAKCRYKHFHACMKSVDVEDVLQAADPVMSRPGYEGMRHAAI